jgi:hypothetical protein
MSCAIFYRCARNKVCRYIRIGIKEQDVMSSWKGGFHLGDVCKGQDEKTIYVKCDKKCGVMYFLKEFHDLQY